MAASTVASLDENGYLYAKHVSQMFDGTHDWWCVRRFPSLFGAIICHARAFTTSWADFRRENG